MDTSTIILNAIRAWNDARTNATDIVNYLDTGNCFFFTPPSYAKGIGEMHVYPGVIEGNLIFFVIPAHYDNSKYHSTFEQYTTICPALWCLGGGRLPDHIARERIARWDDNYRDWASYQVDHTAHGIFQAFIVDEDDFEAEECQVHMGLRLNPIDPLLPDIADMIVCNKIDTQVFYDDFATVVPPYPPSAQSSEFYLLEMAIAPLG